MHSVAKDTKVTAKHSKPELKKRAFRKTVQKCTVISERYAVLFPLILFKHVESRC